MKILLYSNKLKEQDVVDKLFVYVKSFLSNEKVVLWLRKREFDIAPNTDSIGDFDINKLSYLLLSYCGRKFRSELAEILSDLWMTCEQSSRDEDQVHKSFDVLLVSFYNLGLIDCYKYS